MVVRNGTTAFIVSDFVNKISQTASLLITDKICRVVQAYRARQDGQECLVLMGQPEKEYVKFNLFINFLF